MATTYHLSIEFGADVGDRTRREIEREAERAMDGIVPGLHRRLTDAAGGGRVDVVLTGPDRGYALPPSTDRPAGR